MPSPFSPLQSGQTTPPRLHQLLGMYHRLPGERGFETTVDFIKYDSLEMVDILDMK
jgi:hypothetical protein